MRVKAAAGNPDFVARRVPESGRLTDQAAAVEGLILRRPVYILSWQLSMS